MVEEEVGNAVVGGNARALEVERGVVLAEAFVVFEGEAVDVQVGTVLTYSVDEDAAVVVGEVESVEIEVGGLF